MTGPMRDPAPGDENTDYVVDFRRGVVVFVLALAGAFVAGWWLASAVLGG